MTLEDALARGYELLEKVKQDKRVCKGCGKSISGTRNNQRWCTNQCRREHARGKCIVCGGPTNYTKPKINQVCQKCIEIPGGPPILPTSLGRKKGMDGGHLYLY